VQLSQRALALSPSPTMAIDARAKALLAEGQDVINFSAGEPDFDTPEHIKEAAVAAIGRGDTKYTAVAGTVALRQAIADHVAEVAGVRYTPDEIVVSVGAKHSLYNALMALVNPGDKVLLPVPYWVSYSEQIRLAGGEPVFVPLAPSRHYRLSVEDLEAHWQPGVVGLILNSPSNPTGAVVEPDEIRRIAEWVQRKDIWVISDEIYHRLLYGTVRHQSIAAVEGMRERTIYVNGVSKAYAMTGWRIGYAAAPKPLAAAMAGIQSQSTSNPTSIAQAAALAALTGPQDVVEAMRQEFERRRALAYDLLSGIRGLKPLLPDGAFYVWVDTEAWAGRTLAGTVVEDADTLAAVLLDRALVAVVPGSGFGVRHAFRLSFATSQERIREGLGRMAQLLNG
jgi:aspartate aminotransferase